MQRSTGVRLARRALRISRWLEKVLAKYGSALK